MHAEPLNLVINDLAAVATADEICTIERLSAILLSVPWNKAAGASGISYDLIKASDHDSLSLLCSWFNWLFRIGLVPRAWTRSLVVTVPKKGDLNVVSNYRPISLTECFRKLFEHCLERHFNAVLPPVHFSQGGFRADHCVNVRRVF